LNAKTFNSYRSLIYDKSGISLSDGKEALVGARVGKRMRALGIDDHKTYLKHVMQDDTGQEIIDLLDAISTNVTYFFREPDHFTFLGKIMKEWKAAGQKRFRIWSAASSTGEEPYTIAMIILEAIGGNNDVKILATDISTRVLAKAQRGAYKAKKMERMAKMFRQRYFEEVPEATDKLYVVKPALKNMISYKRLNLSTPPFPMRGPLDVVFCRNVMIYFDEHVRRGLLKEIRRLLKPGGYLVVGHAESLIGLAEGFKTAQPSVYVKVD